MEVGGGIGAKGRRFGEFKRLRGYNRSLRRHRGSWMLRALLVSALFQCSVTFHQCWGYLGGEERGQWCSYMSCLKQEGKTDVAGEESL